MTTDYAERGIITCLFIPHAPLQSCYTKYIYVQNTFIFYLFTETKNNLQYNTKTTWFIKV